MSKHILLALWISLTACAAVQAITLTTLGPLGQGGDVNGHSIQIGSGGSVHELDAYLHLGTEPSLRLSTDPVPSNLSFDFRWELSPDATGLTLLYDLKNLGSAPIPNLVFLTLLDAEIDEDDNGFTNEYATTSGDLGLGSDDAAPDAFEVDEPGFTFGNLHEHLFAGDLDNINAVADGVPECVAMSLAFDLGNLAPGEVARIEVLISESGTSLGGLTITQHDSSPASTTTVTYSAQVTREIPVPSDGFRRGDFDGDGTLERSDADGILAFLFAGGSQGLDCFGHASASAADANDNEWITIADYLAVRDALDRSTALPVPTTSCGGDPDDSQHGFDAIDPAFQINAGDPRIVPPTGGVNRDAFIPVLVDTPSDITGLTVILSYDPTTLTPLTGAGGGAPLFDSALGTVRTIVNASEGYVVISLWSRNAGEALLEGNPGTFQSIGSIGFHIQDFSILRPFAWLEEATPGSAILRSTIVDGQTKDHHPNPTAGDFQFVRGNSNNDGRVNISDPIYTLSYLFLGGPDPICLDAADADNDSRINITDPVFTLNFLFLGGRPIPQPYPQCGVDAGATVDLLGCSPCACPPYPIGDPCAAP